VVRKRNGAFANTTFLGLLTNHMSMNTIISNDGTGIAYEKTGNGPTVILAGGVLCYRNSGPAKPLANQLADLFTVITYDRTIRPSVNPGITGDKFLGDI
jgi:hypothetical protein